jgi:hypothetical protein
VAIDDSWATQPPRLRVGEPATRTLTITAKGLAGAQIPEIELPAPAGMRVYPEKTETESRTDGATLFGVSAQRVTLIPTAGGSVEMPEVRVTWWDTVAETERVATVPAMTLEVEGPAGAGRRPEPGGRAGAGPRVSVRARGRRESGRAGGRQLRAGRRSRRADHGQVDRSLLAHLASASRCWRLQPGAWRCPGIGVAGRSPRAPRSQRQAQLAAASWPAARRRARCL